MIAPLRKRSFILIGLSTILCNNTKTRPSPSIELLSGNCPDLCLLFGGPGLANLVISQKRLAFSEGIQQIARLRLFEVRLWWILNFIH